MKIGPISLRGHLILAPMSGITDTCFRSLCKRAGAALVYSEMLSAEAILRNNPYTRYLLKCSAEERPVAMQIFGSCPERMAAGALKLEAEGADLIDLNLGCPARRIVREGSGSALMENPQKTEKIIRAVVRAVRIPVTVKLRVHPHLILIGKICENEGISAVALHARTREQGFRGLPDLPVLRQLKRTLSLPVIGNGGVRDALSLKRMKEETGCDGIMIGRAAVQDPGIFKRLNHFLARGVVLPPSSIEQRLSFFRLYVKKILEEFSYRNPLPRLRRVSSSLFHDFPGAKDWRIRMNSVKDLDELLRILKEKTYVPVT